MVEYRRGDLFTSGAVALVNTVNCVGVMGKGIAEQFKMRYPRMFVDYKYRCNRGLVTPGFMDIHKDGDIWIINFPTKNDWRNPSQLIWIQNGLVELKRAVNSIGLPSIAIPALGCSNGGLNWADVKPLIHNTFVDHPVMAYVYEPLNQRPFVRGGYGAPNSR